jgi:uncharacterized membrane protein
MTEPEAPPPPPPPPASPPPAAESSNRGLMIALAYLWLLALVPLLVEKDDKEVQWHAKHGLVLLVAEVILWVVFAILSMLLGPLACALAIFQMLLFIAIIVVHIMCIVKGIGGERFLIPGVSQYADRF